MTRYKKHKAQTSDGWTEDIFPIMRGYKMACCDCGLVHDIDMDVFEITKFNKDKSFVGHKKKGKKWRVVWRVKRNSRATGQIRRRMKNESRNSPAAAL